MNTPLRDAKREIVIELSNAYFETYRYDRPNDSVEQLQAFCHDLAENDVEELLAAHKEDIDSKMPRMLEGTIELGTYEDDELNQLEEDTLVVITFRKGWNAYHNSVKSILKGEE